jgi:hypothetical protein
MEEAGETLFQRFAREDETGVFALQSTTGPVDTWLEPAESTDEIIVTPSSWTANVLVTDLVAQGAAAFHLAHPGFVDQSLELAPSFQVGAGLKLYFQSHLGWATSTQVARVQIRVGDGTWSDVWSLAGSNGRTQTAFEFVTIDLAPYLGETIRVRFFYEHVSGSAFTNTESNVGWLIDNIQVATAVTKELYAGFGDPTAREVLLLEYINQARADAVAEATRLRTTSDPDVAGAVSFFSVDLDLMETQFAALTRTVPPLAMNGRLLAAARLHSQDMFNNAFQGHVSSSTPVAPNQANDSMGTRVTRQGYAWWTVAENVYAYADSVWHAHAGFNIDWGHGPGGMQTPAGHRNAIHSANFKEIGVGIVEGSNTVGGRTVGPLVVTQNFAVEQGNDVPYLCGVTFVDADGDGFYSLGEGLGAVSIEVDGALFAAQSSTHGAYAIPLPGNGDYTVTFQREGFAPLTATITVSDGANVKVDYLATVAASPVTVLEAIAPTADTLRLRVAYAGAADDLTLLASPDLDTWTPRAATVTDLGAGQFHLDLTLDASPLFLRVVAAP